tara:strand:+ start:2816 stop:3091 length:276 start_codon:yes stop_codon:yes gene_type:complete
LSIRGLSAKSWCGNIRLIAFFILFITPTPFAAVFYVIPISFPLFTPCKRSFAYRAYFYGQVTFFHFQLDNFFFAFNGKGLYNKMPKVVNEA